MGRKDELVQVTKKVDSDMLILFNPLIEQLLFLEEKLEELKKLPFIIVHPDDKKKQKSTVAYKQYKDLSQTYLNGLKVISSACGIEIDVDESPLRKWVESKNAKQKAESG